MLDASDGTLLDAVRRLRWPARRVTGRGLTGAHLSRTLGQSCEFTEYRAYRPGDETRRIDWKLLARTDRAFIRLSQDRSLLPTMIVVDASASMAYPVDSLGKWHQARRIGLGLAAAIHQGGDPVGVVSLSGGSTAEGDGMRRLAARTRRGVVHEIANLLRQVKPGGTVDLVPTLTGLHSARRLVILSDFLGDTEALLSVAGQFCAQDKEVYAIHVIDSTELHPTRAPVCVVDPENDAHTRPMLGAARAHYLKQFADWCDQLSRQWVMRGGYYTRVVTDELAPHVVRKITRPASVGPRG